MTLAKHDCLQPKLFEIGRNTRPRTDPQLTYAILVPDREIVHLYTRPETGRMRYRAPLLPHHLVDHISSIPEPAVLALAGRQSVSHLLFDQRSIFVVPDAWLSHLPARAFDRRARTTARLIHAHILDPIQLRLPPDDDIPF